MLRLVNAFGLEVLPFPWCVVSAAGSCVVIDGGGLACSVSSRLKMVCCSSGALCILSVSSVLVFGPVMFSYPYEYKFYLSKKKRIRTIRWSEDDTGKFSAARSQTIIVGLD